MTILETVFLVIFWAWVLSAALFLRNTLLPRLPISRTPEQFNLHAETVRFRATDGLLLEGWKLSGEPSHPWIVLCHGVGSNRSDLLEIGAGLSERGFNLFLFDFRGHGGSDGRATSFGWQEQRDLEGVLAFLGQETDVSAKPYGVYGISMGGSVALMVAARDERIGAVAADSPYTNLDESIERHLGLMYPFLPKIPFHWFLRSTYRLRFGVWPQQVSPEEGARQLSRCPLLLIQGAEDPRMPREGAERMFTSAARPKELWIVEGAAHLEGYAVNPQAYLRRLGQFFEASLER